MQRGKVWWTDLRCPKTGKRVRKSCRTTDRKLAAEFHDSIRHRMWREEMLGERADPVIKWEEAVRRWLKDAHRRGKKTTAEDQTKLEWFGKSFNGRTLDSLKAVEIQNLLDEKAAATSGATANRYLAVIRAMLRHAHDEWELLKKVPRLQPYQESEGRVRMLAPEEVRRLLDAMPPWLRDLAEFSVATGLRLSNVKDLRWSQVDMDNKTVLIDGSSMKNGNTLALPLSEAAMAVLARRTGSGDRVFTTDKGLPIRAVSAGHWERAKEKAGLDDLRYHDLRHVWASWLRQAGVSLDDIKELGGWKSDKVVRRYAHIVPATHLRGAAEAVGQMLKI